MLPATELVVLVWLVGGWGGGGLSHGAPGGGCWAPGLWPEAEPSGPVPSPVPPPPGPEAARPFPEQTVFRHRDLAAPCSSLRATLGRRLKGFRGEKLTEQSFPPQFFIVGKHM